MGARSRLTTRNKSGGFLCVLAAAKVTQTRRRRVFLSVGLTNELQSKNAPLEVFPARVPRALVCCAAVLSYGASKRTSRVRVVLHYLRTRFTSLVSGLCGGIAKNNLRAALATSARSFLPRAYTGALIAPYNRICMLPGRGRSSTTLRLLRRHC